MWPYYALVFLPMLPLGFSIKRKKRIDRNMISIVWFFSLLLILLVLRHETVGRDLVNYDIMFRQFSRMSWSRVFSVNTESGYVLLNKLISLFTDDFRWVMVICAIISIVPIAYTFTNQIEDSALTIALFITTSNFLLLFSGLRQSISIAIGLIAFEFVKRDKFILYALFAVLALFFHRSAFMLIFMYPVYHLRFKRIWLLWILPMLGIIIIFNKQIFSFLLMFISDYWNLGMSPTGAYMMLILLFVFAAFSVIIPDEMKMDKEAMGIRNLLMLSVVVQVFASLNPMAMRMNYYFLVFLPLAIPMAISRTRIRYRQIAKVAKYVMIGFFLLQFFISSPKTNSLDTFPYHFFWENFII